MSHQRGGRGAWRGKGQGNWREQAIKSSPPHNLKPSQEYLQLVNSCSEPANSTPPRKLFVLSLGNTLTLRTGNRNAPILRAYLPVFMRYVTHQETRDWADVMVWSAAAKRNVMPGLHKAMRVVIGNGNTGRSDRQDRRMSFTSARTDAQYAEDEEVPFWDGLLRDVWTQEDIAKLKGEEKKPVVHTPAPKPKDLSLAWTSSSFAHLGGEKLQAHDAHTTLLLDDTPTNDCAPQHPYNHLRLGSFDKEMRRKDVQVMERIERERNYKKRMMHKADDGLPDLASLSLSDKTQDKPEEPGEPEDPEEWTGPGYDITLLAAIGIFEEMKRQSSVPAWVKSGGLWGDPYGFHMTGRTQDKNDELGGEHIDAVSKTQDKGKVKGARIQPESDPERISAAVGNGVSETYSTGNGTKTWFGNEQIVRYWAVKGREACKRLRIDPDEHGL